MSLAQRIGQEFKTLRDNELTLKFDKANIENILTSVSTTNALSAAQGKVLKDSIDSISTLLSSNDVDLDTLQEIVAFIKANKGTLDSLGIDSILGLQTALNSKVDDSQVLTDVPSGAVFTDTTYTVGDGGLTEKNFTTALKNKLDTDASQDIINETTAVKLYSGTKRSTWTQGLPGFTGAIRLELVNLFGYSMDGLMTIRIKETGSAAIRLDISGRWNASTSWGAYDAISDSAINVRFARDGSKVYLIIGEVGTVWGNTRLEIDNVLTNYNVGQLLSFATTTINSLSGYTIDATIESKRLVASAVVVAPVGNISAVTVQAALAELDSEKANQSTTYTKTEIDTITGNINSALDTINGVVI